MSSCKRFIRLYFQKLWEHAHSITYIRPKKESLDPFTKKQQKTIADFSGTLSYLLKIRFFFIPYFLIFLKDNQLYLKAYYYY